jgi:hypothetical protein
MRETLRQHLLESRDRKSGPFGPLKQNCLSRFELSVSLISRASKITSTFYLKITK